MNADPTHLRILPFSYTESLSAARLRAITLAAHGPRQDLLLDYDELRLTDRRRYSMCCNWVTNGFAKAAR